MGITGRAGAARAVVGAALRGALRSMLAAATLAALASAAAAEKRVALVMGNGAYAHADKLPNPANDATAMKAALEALGFEVTLAVDLPRLETLEALDRFAGALPGAEAALFYYSGHGMQIDGTNFLLPVDVEAKSERSVRYGSIDISEIVRDMEAAADVSIVVLDACRDNPFADQLAALGPRSRSTAATRGLARIKATGSGTIISYAAAAGTTASDGEGAHSPFTEALLKHIAEPNLDVALMLRNVTADVVEATGSEQRPETLSSLLRGFYMNPVEAAAPDMPSIEAAEAKPPPQPAANVPPAPVATPQAQASEPKPGGPATTADAGAAAAKAPTEASETSAGAEAFARRATPVATDGGPYADLLARLVLDRRIDAPKPAWSPPETRAYDEAEPNNSFGTARPIATNAELTLSIAPRGDADWVYFTTGSGGVLSFATGDQPPEIDLTMRLFDGDGRDMTGWTTTPRPGGVLEGSFDIAGPGNYRLEIRDAHNDAESPAPIRLTLGFEPQEDGYEPNDTLSKAKRIAPDGTHRINILPVGDADLFVLAIPAPGELSVLATDVPEALDVTVRLLSYDMTDLSSWITGPRKGGDTEAAFAVKEPGYYVLEVRDAQNDARSGDAFTLKTGFTASPDRYEPNDSVGAATAIEASGEHVVTIFPTGDADWYRIEVGRPGELQVEAREVPDTLDVTFRVFDPDHNDMTGWIPAPRKGGVTSGFTDLKRPGTYFVEVRDSYNDAGDVRPFQLATTFTPAVDTFEPNDTAAQATALRPDGAVALNILPKGDADWFKVDVEEPGELYVTVDDGPKSLDITFRVFDADRKDLTGWIPAYAKGGLTDGRVDLAAPGAYFIEVRDAYNDERSAEPATLATRFTPTLSSAEPNDTFGTATEVALVGSSIAHILPLGDADWHVFYVPQPGTLDVTIDSVPEELDVTYRIFDGDQRDLTGWIPAPRKGGVTTGSTKLESPGWYWMEIRDAYNDARSPQPFRVTRAFTPL